MCIHTHTYIDIDIYPHKHVYVHTYICILFLKKHCGIEPQWIINYCYGKPTNLHLNTNGTQYLYSEVFIKYLLLNQYSEYSVYLFCLYSSICWMMHKLSSLKFIYFVEKIYQYSRIYIILAHMYVHINERKDKTIVSRKAFTTLFMTNDCTMWIY